MSLGMHSTVAAMCCFLRLRAGPDKHPTCNPAVEDNPRPLLRHGHILGTQPLRTRLMTAWAAGGTSPTMAHLHDPALEDSSRPGGAAGGRDALKQQSQLAQAVPPQQVHTEALSHQDQPAQVLYLPHNTRSGMCRGAQGLFLLSHQEQPAQVLYGNARQDQHVGGDETRQAHPQERCKGCQRLLPQRHLNGGASGHTIGSQQLFMKWSELAHVPIACLTGFRVAESPVRAGVAAWRGR